MKRPAATVTADGPNIIEQQSQEPLIVSLVDSLISPRKALTAMGPTQGISNCVASYVTNVLACNAELCQLSELEPSGRVNLAFDKLVGLCSQTPDQSVVAKVRSFTNF